ncbi:DNA damage-binding protein 1a [Gaertneriomyces sp. JEL0708]|nr:DNA damage-binding protein 1a [Gaertneriomyces sp. JEL0708]
MASHYYVATAKKPDSVSLAIRANFTATEDVNLIVSKTTHLEVHVLENDPYDENANTLRLLLDLPIYGRISTLRKFRPPGSPTDFLFLTIERYQCFILSYNAASQQVVTEAGANLQDRTGYPASEGHVGMIDPDHQLIGLHLYQGLVKFIPITSRQTLDEFQVLCMELMQSPKEDDRRPLLVLLHQDAKGIRHVKTYIVDITMPGLIEYSELPSKTVDVTANLILPVTRIMGGGVIVLSEQNITWINSRGLKTISITPTIMKSWNQMDDAGSRFLLGDYMGNLFVLVLTSIDGAVGDIRLQYLGVVSQPSSIVYLESGYVFVGSHFEDSQLVQLSIPHIENSGYLNVKAEYENLAPITDFCLVDVEKQGQGQLVACCGGHKGGSLRIIRSGIGIEILGALSDVPELSGIWSLKPSSNAESHNVLVLSFISETRLQTTGADGILGPMDDSSTGCFMVQEATLACSNVLTDKVLQVTPSSAMLMTADMQTTVSHWRPPVGRRIAHASVNTCQLLLALDDGHLLYFEIQESALLDVSQLNQGNEVSCLNIESVDQNNEKQSHYALVGTWRDTRVRLYSLPDLRELQSLSFDMIPRSVLLITFDHVRYGMAGLGDGYLHTFVIGDSAAISSQRKVPLGNAPIILNSFISGGAPHVFASSDRPTVIHNSNGKLVFSNLNLTEVSRMCPFNFEGEALALISDGALKIGAIESAERLHIKKVFLGETARRIAYNEESRTFGLLTIKTVLDENGEEDEKHFFKILDDRTFEQLDEFAMGPLEHVQSIMCVTFPEDSTMYYCVGTALVLPVEEEPSKGRLLLFSVTDERKVRLIDERETAGCPYCISYISGKLVVGINSKVQLFSWVQSDDKGTMSLVPGKIHYGNILAYTIAVRGEFVLVGDLMKSVSLLQFKPATQSLDLIARHPDTNWMMAVEAIDDDNFLGAENSHNLFALRKQSELESEEDSRRLAENGAYHLGDLVNVMKHGSLVMKIPGHEVIATPVLLFCTVNGGIGIVATLEDEMFRILQDLQDNMRKCCKGVGGLSHAQWRRFNNGRRSRESENFIDGDLIESFLHLGLEQQKVIVEGSHPKLKKLPQALGEVIQIVEELSRLH